MTLSDEYTRIWRAPRGVASICFLLVRYIAVLTVSLYCNISAIKSVIHLPQTIASTYAAFGASHLSTEVRLNCLYLSQSNGGLEVRHIIAGNRARRAHE